MSLGIVITGSRRLFYLWCRLPEGRGLERTRPNPMDENVVLAPGNVFNAAQTANPFFRFNVAQSRDPRIVVVLQRIMAPHSTR